MLYGKNEIYKNNQKFILGEKVFCSMQELFIVYIDNEHIALSKENAKEINIIKDVQFLMKITEFYTILEKDFPPKYKFNLSPKKLEMINNYVFNDIINHKALKKLAENK